MPPNLGVFLIGNQHYFKRVKSPGVFLKHMAVIWLIQSLSPYLAKLHLSFCVWVHLCHDVGSVLLLLSAYAHSPVGRSTKNLLDLTDFLKKLHWIWLFIYSIYFFKCYVLSTIWRPGLIYIFMVIQTAAEEKLKQVMQYEATASERAFDTLRHTAVWEHDITATENNNRDAGNSLQRISNRAMRTWILSHMKFPDGVTVLPFCCCIRDWFTAGWGTMVGGGGSAAWLCWLGRARVVPTEAAEEHTIHCNCSSQNIKKAVHPNYTKLNPNSQEKCSQWPS